MLAPRIRARYTTRLCYENVCRGLFERDKILYASLICFGVLKHRHDIDPGSWNLLMRGAGVMDIDDASVNPDPGRITEAQWDLVQVADALQLQPKPKAGRGEGEGAEGEGGEGEGAAEEEEEEDERNMRPMEGIAESISSNWDA